MRRLVHTIQTEDVGKGSIRLPACNCKCCKKRGLGGEILYLRDWFGFVQAIDVGKRIYSVKGIYQVENDKQLAKRKERQCTR